MSDGREPLALVVAFLIVAMAFVCACLVLLSMVVDHYDERNKYKIFAKGCKYLGWLLFALALVWLFATAFEHVREVRKEHTMPDILIWVFVVLVLVLGGSVVAFLVTQRRKTAVLNRLAVALGGRVEGHTFTARSGSTAYQVTLFGSGSRMQADLRVRVSCRSRGSFQIVSVHALFSGADDVDVGTIGQAGPELVAPSGDPDFDRDFLVQTKAVDFASAFFSAPEKRRAIREIFALGIDVIRHDETVFETTWFFPSAEPTDVDPSIITRVVAHLSTLTKDLPSA